MNLTLPRFVRTVSEETVTRCTNNILMNFPDDVESIIEWYSIESGINRKYIDLRTAIRGLLCSC